MATVLSNLPKPGEDVRYVDVVVDSNGKNRLCVDMAATITVGDIQIGAVEIKDATTDRRANVLQSQQGHDGIVVISEEVPKSKVVIYGSSLVSVSGSLVISTYTVPTGKKFFFTGAMVGGEQEAEFDFQISGVTIAKVRNSGSNRTIVVKFPEEPEASAGATVDIVATNIGDKVKSYEATIFGYTV